LGEAAIAAIKAVHETNYITGSGADVLYGVGLFFAKPFRIEYFETVGFKKINYTLTFHICASPTGGASDDYAKEAGIKYSVTVEMRDGGSYGKQFVYIFC